ncbi:MAG: hypothetical protein K2J39_01705 [Ruminococcus sp.]|nr:hypothetical protein [Ruminococcus sp.]
MSVYFNFGLEYVRFREYQIENIINYMHDDLKMNRDDISVPPERLTISYGVADTTGRIRASILEWSSFQSRVFFDDTTEYNNIEIIISVDSNFFTARGVKSRETGTVSEIEFPHGLPDDRYSWDWYEQLAYQACVLLTDGRKLNEFAVSEHQKDNTFNLFENEKKKLSEYQNT